MGVEGRNTSWKEAGKLKLIKHNSVCLDGGSVWITCPCPNSSLPGPSCPAALPPPHTHPAFFINGSSWRSFSSIQGLLPFGVLISPDAHDTAKAVLETIALVGGRGREEPRALWGPRWMGSGSTPGYLLEGRTLKQESMGSKMSQKRPQFRGGFLLQSGGSAPCSLERVLPAAS